MGVHSSPGSEPSQHWLKPRPGHATRGCVWTDATSTPSHSSLDLSRALGLALPEAPEGSVHPILLLPPGVEFSHHVRWTFSKSHVDLLSEVQPWPECWVWRWMGSLGPSASAKAISVNACPPSLSGLPPRPTMSRRGSLHPRCQPRGVSLPCAFCMLGKGLGVTAPRA